MPLVIYPSLDALTTAIALKDGVTTDNLPRGTDVYYSQDLKITASSIMFASYSIVP